MAKRAISGMRASVIFETKAIVPPGAPQTWNLPYLNLVVSGATSLSPHALLKTLKEIERELGRDLQAQRWAPRVIDLDILAWDDLVFADEVLKLPHPELMNRPFLVSLMAFLQPGWRHPNSSLTLSEMMHTHLKFDPEEGKCFMPSPQMVGIVNVTPDSFSDGGQSIQPEQAILKIEELATSGAAVIDIGAQSTRPGATPLSEEEEWERLAPVLDLLVQSFRVRQAIPQISLDSFSPEVIKRALHRASIDWINDVKGGEDESLLKIVAETKCKIVISHSLTVPPTRNAMMAFEKSPITQICDWAQKKIEQLAAFGIEQERIILDPGIGFGKSSFQALSLLREIDLLKKLGCEILVGHSRKQFLNRTATSANRDLQTVGISHYLLKKGVDYLRVHNVEAHQRSLTALALMEGVHAF